MKRKLASCAVIGLLSSSVAHADLLSNGNLDATSVGPQTLATPTGWSVNARRVSGPFADGCSSEGFANFAASGGSGLFFKPFQGSLADPLSVSLYQDNPAVPGLTYTFTGWAGAEANYSGLIAGGLTRSVFSIDFLNAANNVIGSASLDLAASGLGTANGNPFGYSQYSLSATAPAGTVLVRAGASMIDAYANPLGGGQAFVVDAFVLVPEPSVLGLAVLGMAGLMVCWRRRRKEH